MAIYGHGETNSNNRSVASQNGFIRDWLKEQPMELGEANGNAELLDLLLPKAANETDKQLFALI